MVRAAGLVCGLDIKNYTYYDKSGLGHTANYELEEVTESCRRERRGVINLVNFNSDDQDSTHFDLLKITPVSSG